VILLNDKSVYVLEQYDIEVKKILKGRGALIIDTDKGFFRFFEYKGTLSRLIYEDELLNYILEHGFPNVNSIIKNKEAVLFSADTAGTKYVLTRHFNGGECDVRNKHDLIQAVETLAELHNITSHAELGSTEYIPVLSGSLEEIKKHNLELKRIRNYIRAKTRKTEFEYDVLAHFNEFYELAREAEQELLASGCDTEHKQAVSSYSICHGNYSYHNIIHCQGNSMAVINFEHSGRGMLIRDLYFFLRKAMEKHDWNQALGLELLESYDKTRAISAQERKILKILLGYPEKFWKVLNHYYNGNKAYLPDQMKDKMQKVYIQQKNKNKFVASKNLF